MKLNVSSMKYPNAWALVDDDAPKGLLGGYKWTLTKAGYVRGAQGAKTYYLHRLLTNAGDDQVVDHLNGNKLDNRLSNLRVTTKSVNASNSKGKSGFKGVSWHPQNEKWRARITWERKRIHIGLYDTPEEAARAYDEAAKHYLGASAYLNFPDPDALPDLRELSREELELRVLELEEKLGIER